jgi:hypothetical protein
MHAAGCRHKCAVRQMLRWLQLMLLVGWGDGTAEALRAGDVQARYWQPAEALHQHVLMPK